MRSDLRRLGVAAALPVLLTAAALGVLARPSPGAPHRSAAVAQVAPTAPGAADRVLPSSRPVSLRIPALGLTSRVTGVGLTPSGALQVPEAAFPAGWYTGSPAPGDRGPAVLAGHVDYAGKAGVFSGLRRLRTGDQVQVARADGSTAVFAVTRVERVAKDDFPTAEVYGDVDHAALRLITCGGSFDRDVHSYRDNVIVFADLLRTEART